MLPLVYVLMPRKSEQMYNRVLDVICGNRQFNPTEVISDFEMAAMNSMKVSDCKLFFCIVLVTSIYFQAHFPQVRIHACFFHLGQSLYRQVQSLGHSDRYLNDDDFREHVKMIAALAFVPPNHVVDAFELLEEQFGDDDEFSGKLELSNLT